MQLEQRARLTLLSAAHWAIEHELGKRKTAFNNRNPDPALLEPRACFVTLHRHSKLRGCSGTLRVEQPLLDDVMRNANSAAFHDPRFPALDAGELDQLRITISVLSALQPLAAANRTELLNKLHPYHDGLVIETGTRSATFLPVAWNNLPEPRAFLDALMQKIGLEPSDWLPSLRFLRYQTTSFQEEDPA